MISFEEIGLTKRHSNVNSLLRYKDLDMLPGGVAEVTLVNDLVIRIETYDVKKIRSYSNILEIANTTIPIVMAQCAVALIPMEELIKTSKESNAETGITESYIHMRISNYLYKDSKTTDQSQLSVKNVFEIVARLSGCTVEDITGKSRAREIVNPRQFGSYLARKLVRSKIDGVGAASLKEVGDFINKDHATVLNSEKVVKDKIESSVIQKDHYEILSKIIKASI